MLLACAWLQCVGIRKCRTYFKSSEPQNVERMNRRTLKWRDCHPGKFLMANRNAKQPRFNHKPTVPALRSGLQQESLVIKWYLNPLLKHLSILPFTTAWHHLLQVDCAYNAVQSGANPATQHRKHWPTRYATVNIESTGKYNFESQMP